MTKSMFEIPHKYILAGTDLKVILWGGGEFGKTQFNETRENFFSLKIYFTKKFSPMGEGDYHVTPLKSAPAYW